MMKALIFLLPFALFALPKDLAVQSGTAFVRPCENHLHIKNSPHAILHWADFSIGKGESVHFAQESAKSVVLNRVTSSQTSHLLGQLNSNGAVFLINPHGVVIGADASIQTAGFLASTANLSNENFLEGHYLFTHPGEGAILNHGVIQCAGGDIYLIAKTIENSGTLQGENVSLISAYEVLLTPRENQKVTIRLSLDETEVSALKNEGASFYEKAIHHSGSAEAFGTKEERGRIYLIAQKGETGVEGPLLAEGGEIQVLGETVHLREGADLDVSGPRGGTILIGGDFQGKNKEILTAEKTTVENALLTANGTQGDGGKIIVWSENETYCNGEISASAIGETGNGGFLEISGRKGVEAPLIPDLSSETGKPGTFLLDPGAVTIDSGSSPGTGGVFGVDYLKPLLASGNVSLSTTLDGTTGLETLTVTSAVAGASSLTWTSNNDLTLTAARGIEVQSGATISFSGSGTLSVTASGGAGVPTYPGILLDGVTVSATGDGSIALSGTGNDDVGLSFQGGASVSIGGTGSLTLTGNGGANSHGISITNGTVTTSGTGTLTLTGNGGAGTASRGIFMNGSSAQITTTGNGPVIINGTGGGTGTAADGVALLSAAKIAPTGTSTLTINGVASPLASGSSGIFLSGTNSLITTANGAMNLTAEGGGAGDDNAGVYLSTDTAITSTGSGNVTIDAIGTSTGDNSNKGIYLTGNGRIVLSGGGNLNITNATGSTNTGAGGGNIGVHLSSVNQGISTNTGSLTIVATGASNATGSSNTGLSMAGSNPWIRSTSGDMTITATGAPLGTDSNRGISMNSSSSGNGVIIETPGLMTLVPRGGGATSGSNNIGLYCFNKSLINSSGAHPLTFTTIGQGLGNNCVGLQIDGSARIIAASDLTITAIGSEVGTTGADHTGILAREGTIQSTAGSISITARGSTSGSISGGGHMGIGVRSSGRICDVISAQAMNIDVAGALNGTGSGNIGLSMTDSFAGIGSVGFLSTNGDITITAVGSPVGANNNIGIYINSTFTGINARRLSIQTGGLITLIPRGGGATSGSGNVGLYCGNWGLINSTGNHPLTFTTMGQGLGNSCVGLQMGGNGQISAVSDLTITAIGSEVGTTGADHTGILATRGTIQSTSGSVNITARGSTSGSISGGGHMGIGVRSSGRICDVISAQAMNIDVAGALNGTGSGNIGLLMTDSFAGIGSVGFLSTNGDITVTAVGSPVGADNNIGIYINNTHTGASGRILSIQTAGLITLSPRGGGITSGSGNIGLYCGKWGAINSTGNHPLTFTTIGQGLGNSCVGLQIRDSGTISAASDLTITAIGSEVGTTGTDHAGILTDRGIIQSTSGSVNITARGSTAGSISGGNHIGLGVSSGCMCNVIGDQGMTVDAIGALNGTGSGNIGLSMLNTSTGDGAFGFESTNGDITISAVGSPVGADNNIGILMYNSRTSNTRTLVIQTGGVITVNSTGGGATSGSGNIGLYCRTQGLINSIGNNSLTINAVSGGSGGNNRGVYITSNGLIQALDGALTITGTGGEVSGSSNQGIYLDTSGVRITSRDGPIALTGNGGFASQGIHITAGTIQTTGTGTLSCTGIGNFLGIDMTGASSSITTASGAIALTGTGEGTAASSHGIRVNTGASIIGNTGQITLTGTGSMTGGGNSRGILMNGSGALVQTTSGDIILKGTGGNGGAGNHGIAVFNGANIQSTSGTIRSPPLSGASTGGGGSFSCHGIIVAGTGTLITTTSGDIDLIGIGGGTTGPNYGISVISPAQIISTGSLLKLTGTGNGTGSSNFGINLENTSLSKVGTDITLIGTGSPNGLDNNYGISLSSGSSLTTDSGAINLTGTGGGTGQNNHGLFFNSPGNITTTSGAITINATGSSTGTNQCMGLLVNGASTQITTDTGSIDITATGQGTGSTNPGLLIQNGGSLNATGSGTITATGTGSLAGTSGCAGITLSGVGSGIAINTGAINLTGTAGGNTSNNSGIEVLGGALVSSTGGGNITLTGNGAGAGQDNPGIFVTTPSQINTTSGTITATGTGGTGTTGCFGILVDGASAQILSDTGTVDLTGTATGTLTHNSGIRISNGATVSSPSTNVTLTGTGSTAGTDNNYGIELLGSGITTGTGNITLTGTGGGTGQGNQGLYFTSPGNITTTSGAILINASGSNAGTDECMGLLIDGIGTEITSDTGPITIGATGQGSGLDNMGLLIQNGGQVSSNTGSITLTGTAGGTTPEGITLQNQARISSSGSMNLSTFSDLLITNNSSIDSQGNSPLTLNITTDLRILGGAGAGEPAYINLTDGAASLTIGRDLIVQGGDGTNSPAQIGNVGLSLNASAPLTLQAGRDILLTGSPVSGSFAQIGHLNTVGSTLGGNITLTSGNDLLLLGGLDPTSYARIGHGGQVSSATYTPSTMTLISGKDLILTSDLGEAQIVNENGPLTLVVDNLFPTPPLLGPGAFILGSTLTATGELRIYTSREELNTINSPINGAPFVPGVFDVNTNTEQWSTYYPNGTYEGAPFKFYYKDPPIDLPPSSATSPLPNAQLFENIAANLVSLRDLLPVLRNLRAPTSFPNYHFKSYIGGKGILTFSPYGSFIFEDTVWWVGE